MRSVCLKCFQRLLGLMAAAAVVCRLGLLHMRQLQLWLKACATPGVCHCMRTYTPLLYRTTYERGVSVGQKKSHDDGCVFDGLGSLLAYSTWTSVQSKWHINFLELRAVSLALQHFLPFLEGPPCSHSTGIQGSGIVHHSPRWYSFSPASDADKSFILMASSDNPADLEPFQGGGD